MKIYLPEDVLTAARERVRWCFKEFQHVYVGFSGGKDSTVILNLALEAAEEMGRLPLPVFFLDQEAEWQSVIDYVQVVMRDPRVSPRWLQIPFRLTNSTSQRESYLHCWDEAHPELWIRQKDPLSIKKNVYGTDRFHKMFMHFLRYHHFTKPACYLAGVRCEESPGRMMGLTQSEAYKGVTWGRLLDQRRAHLTFYPIYDWSVSDVWKAIHDHGWPYCNTGEAPVWMGDYSFRRIDKVKLGDEIIAFTDPEDGRRSRLVRSKVIGVRSLLAKVVKIVLESGRVIRCTAEHRWLRNPNSNRSTASGNWRFGPAQVGDDLAFVVQPEYFDSTTDGRFGAGWLGGIYDGEGSGDRISQSRNANPIVCAKIERLLRRFGLPFNELTGEGASDFRLLGGRSTLVRFVNIARPVKMESLDALILTARYRIKDRVVSIEPDGTGTEPVYALQTTEGTYIAWGYASSNSKLYDYLWQYGVPVQKMRVSNLHHETAVQSLFYAQEIEADTWQKIQSRLAGINTAGQLGDDFFGPKELPPMFSSWVEYRDYLLENLIESPESRRKFAEMFAAYDGRYDDPGVKRGLMMVQISTILVNDVDLTKLRNFGSAHFMDSNQLGSKTVGGRY